ncbi:MAG: ZPR1 zinc finger domain-containing protein [Candidatus Odinarchaeota archaeon]
MISSSKCPVCEKGLFKISSNEIEIPYYGHAYIVTLICEKCSFRIADIILSKVYPPTAFYAKIRSAEDLKIKVVKSSTATIRIPELGVKMEPGACSQGFITNIEGILQRIEDVTLMMKDWLKEKKKIERCTQLLLKLSKAANGEFEFTFILEDPFGNSLLVGEQGQIVRKRKLSQKQLDKIISRLK